MKASRQRTGSEQTSNSGMPLAIATIVVLLGTIAANTLSNIFPPGGLNTGEVANTILGSMRILPASYAFAIWGLIYVGMLAYAVYQFRPPQRSNPTIQRVNVLLIVASIAQIIWLVLFSYRLFWLSVLAMLAILLPLIGAYLTLGVGKERATRERKWFANISFSVYLGWISVATIVNIAGAFFVSGWQGEPIGQEPWAALVLVIGAIVGAIAAIQRSDAAFTLVFVWAYAAIALRQSDAPLVWGTAVISAIVLVALLVFDRMKQRSLRSERTNP